VWKRSFFWLISLHNRNISEVNFGIVLGTLPEWNENTSLQYMYVLAIKTLMSRIWLFAPAILQNRRFLVPYLHPGRHQQTCLFCTLGQIYLSKHYLLNAFLYISILDFNSLSCPIPEQLVSIQRTRWCVSLLFKPRQAPCNHSQMLKCTLHIVARYRVYQETRKVYLALVRHVQIWFTFILVSHVSTRPITNS